MIVRNNSSVYEGEWNNDKMEGVGRIIHPAFYYFEGQWLDGKANGYGRCSDEQNDHNYEGYFQEDLMHGLGNEQWTGGIFY